MSDISIALELLEQGKNLVSKGNSMIEKAEKIISESYRTQEEEGENLPRPNGLTLEETQNVRNKFRKRRLVG